MDDQSNRDTKKLIRLLQIREAELRQEIWATIFMVGGATLLVALTTILMWPLLTW